MTGDDGRHAEGGLVADLGVTRGDFRLDARIEVPPGVVVGVLGPNGAGKSTVLAALAGLVPLDAGRIVLAGSVLDAPDDGVLVPPQRRRVGVVFQDLLLFRHLSALDNVAFGPRARGVPRAAAQATARAWLERVGLADLAGSRPATLSGGQAQRVALARALATDPDLLLLDEPMSALDVATRLEVRGRLRRHLDLFPGPVVLVTHDPVDALVLADRLVVLEGGRVTQTGTPAEVARAPRTEYVARLVGLNLFRGRADRGAVVLDDGGVLRTADDVTGRVLVTVPPAAVALHEHHPEGSPRNVWSGTVRGLEQHGQLVRVRLEGAPAVLADVTAAAVAELGLHEGRAVWASVKATEVRAEPE